MLIFLFGGKYQDIHHKIKPEEVELVRRDYTANEGWETFLSYEDTRQVRNINIDLPFSAFFIAAPTPHTITRELKIKVKRNSVFYLFIELLQICNIILQSSKLCLL